MRVRPVVFFIASFLFGFVLTSFATPALARTRLPRKAEVILLLPTPTLSSSPEMTPSPLPTTTPSPTPKSTPVVHAATIPDAKTFIMNEINNFRRSKSLSEVRTNSETCNFAKTRASEITKDFNHNGFRDRVNNKTLPYSGYSQVTENIAETWDFKRVVGLWINSPSHRENMEKDTPFVCVESSGNFYAYEGWKP